MQGDLGVKEINLVYDIYTLPKSGFVSPCHVGRKTAIDDLVIDVLY